MASDSSWIGRPVAVIRFACAEGRPLFSRVEDSLPALSTVEAARQLAQAFEAGPRLIDFGRSLPAPADLEPG